MNRASTLVRTIPLLVPSQSLMTCCKKCILREVLYLLGSPICTRESRDSIASVYVSVENKSRQSIVLEEGCRS